MNDKLIAAVNDLEIAIRLGKRFSPMDASCTLGDVMTALMAQSTPPAPHAGTVGESERVEQMGWEIVRLNQVEKNYIHLSKSYDELVARLTTPPPSSPDAKLGEPNRAVMTLRLACAEAVGCLMVITSGGEFRMEGAKETLASLEHALREDAALTRPAAPSATERKV